MRFRSILLLIPLALLMGTSVHAQTLITNVNVQGFAISPNGDGEADVTVIDATLADSATTVLMSVFRMDTTTVVDTLFAGVTMQPDSVVRGTWDGRDFNGASVADDSFLVCIRADNGSLQEAQYRAITVDRVAPQVAITNLFPFDFGPGSPDPLSDRLTIEFSLTDAFPSQGARVTVDVLSPTGTTTVAALRTNDDLPLDSTYTDTWDGNTATRDGIHTVVITAVDQAKNTTTQFATVNVDLDDPEIRFLDPVSNQAFNVPPDSVRGWAYDRTGLRPLEYALLRGTPVFRIVPSIMTRDDTLFFSAPVADSISGEGEYTFEFTVVDDLGREAPLNPRRWAVTIDTNAPLAPTLKQPTSPTTNPRAIVEAEFDVVDTRELVFSNNGVEVGSEVVLGQTEAFFAVTLSPGTNRITAFARDLAGNESGPSAAVIVEFDSNAALTFPTPFVPNDEFQMNFMRDVALIRLTVYDLAGNVVERLGSNQLGRTFTLPWNGNNGDGEPVKRGPLIVVLEVTYPGGEKNVVREGMLFTPVPEQ